MKKNNQSGQALMMALLSSRYGEKLKMAKINEISLNLKDQEQIQAMYKIVSMASNEEELTEMIQKFDKNSQKALVKEAEGERRKQDLIKAIAVFDGNNAELIGREIKSKRFRNLENIYQELSMIQLINCKLNNIKEKNAYFKAFKDKLKVLKIIIDTSIKGNKDVIEVFDKQYDDFSDKLKEHIKIRGHHLKDFFKTSSIIEQQDFFISKEQFIKLYKTLPESLKRAYFSEENVDFINSLCRRNNFSNIQKKQIFHFFYDVLLGIIPIEEAQNIFKQEIEIEFERLKQKIYLQIYRNIFSPLKNDLISLYKIG